MLRLFSPARARRAAVVLSASLALAACTAGGGGNEASAPEAEPAASGTPLAAAAPEATISTSLQGHRGPVPVDEAVEVDVERGHFERVVVRSEEERLRGELSSDGSRWEATGRLEPGQRYRVRAVTVDDLGRHRTHRRAFRTEDLPLDRQTYPSIAPLAGETVGVGMPVIVKFDVAVTDHASIERHLMVESTPRQVGSWHWLNDHEVHWRPKRYWRPGTHVSVHANVNSVPAGEGIYGQLSRTVSFDIGDAVISKVDVASHTMRVFVNGDLRRTMPISAGKPGFTTRSGTKVIIEKVRKKIMDAATLGIAKNDPEYYRLPVEYAMRVTYSGEFLHAAPWSSGAQGIANVSHGCVGMATDNAAWLYQLTKRGDVVEVTGSDRQMSLYNGYGDWNVSFREYAKGSAL